MELEIWHLWMLLSIGLFIVEIITSTFSSLCFGVGALSAGILSYANYSISVQLVVFITIALLGIFLLKPYLQQKLVSKTGVKVSIGTNFIGREAYVMEEINPQKRRGKVIIGGTGKKAIAISGEIIPKGAFVEIVDSNEIELTVKEI
ncbi:NfeD family protein [Marinifilum caeruleilacunae]|uniref:NfeD family protein n=1 Tax=Marinifilum caeruleilacunae TaxID=2499076 RepID=A0ABX1WYT7_9BACT|nr:NfeD family protein [Marinifilum caeruleilacunae]NOU61081.1 NfeD family protein [Marinifilum caeruleilacunae]